MARAPSKAKAKTKPAPKKKPAAKKVAPPLLDDLRSLAALTSAALLVVDAEGVVQFATPAAARHLSTTSELLLGFPAPDVPATVQDIEWRKTPCRLLELTAVARITELEAKLEQSELAAADTHIAELEAELEELAVGMHAPLVHEAVERVAPEAAELLDHLALHDPNAETATELAQASARIAELEAQVAELSLVMHAPEVSEAVERQNARLAQEEAEEVEFFEHLAHQPPESASAARIADLQAQLQRLIAQPADSQKAEIDALKSAQVRAEWQLEIAVARGEDLEAELTAARVRLEEVERMLAQAQELALEYRRFEASSQTAESRTQELERQLPQALAKAEGAQEQMEALRAQAEELEQANRELRQTHTGLEQANRLLEHTSRELQQTNRVLEQANRDLVASQPPPDALLAAKARSLELERELRFAVARAEELEARLAGGNQVEEVESALMRATEMELADALTRAARVPELEGQLSEAHAALTRALQLEHQAVTRSQELQKLLEQGGSAAIPAPLAAIVRMGELETQLGAALEREHELMARLEGPPGFPESGGPEWELRQSARVAELETQLGDALERERLLVSHLEGEAGDDVGSLRQAARLGQLESQLSAALERERNMEPATDSSWQEWALTRIGELEAQVQAPSGTLSFQRLERVEEPSPLAAIVRMGELETQLDAALERERQYLRHITELEAFLPDAPPEGGAAQARVAELEGQLARLQGERRPDPVLDGPAPVLYYQPVFELISGKLAGVEALMCWHDPEHGLLHAPGDTLPVNVCFQALIQVCQQAAAWRADGWEFFCAFDAGLALLHHAELPGILREARRLGELPPSMLVLEIPGLPQSPDGLLEKVLAELVRDGVGLTLDSLGLGTTSFAHLFMAGMVKLDGRLVAGLPLQPWAQQAARASLGLARGQGLRAAAVGIETEAQYRWLRNAQCELGQGTHLSPPVSADAIAEFARWGRLYD